MDERERFRRLFQGAPVDRPPLLEEGVRDEVIELWRTQGMPPDKSHLEIFGLTPHENIGPDIRFLPRYSGRIMDLSAQEYRRAFNPSRLRFPHDWPETVRRLARRDHIVCIWASRGFFQALGVGDWPTLEKALVAAIKHPAGVRDRLKTYADFCARMLELTMRDVDPEFIYLSEPISDNRGPLISPGMFEEFMVPVYERITEAARARGCEHILASTYGNTSRLFPAMIKAGVTILWISDAAEVAELDYRNLRRNYPRLGLIGGIPLSILKSETAQQIDHSLYDIVAPLLISGRYIPLAGGRVRENISWMEYRHYRESLNRIVCGSPAASR